MCLNEGQFECISTILYTSIPKVYTVQYLYTLRKEKDDLNKCLIVECEIFKR